MTSIATSHQASEPGTAGIENAHVRVSNPTLRDADERQMPWTKVVDYVVTYPTNSRPPRIQLQAQQGSLVTELVFWPTGSILPADTRDKANHHRDEFTNVLDLLRNESPIYYVFNGSGDEQENGLQAGGKVGTQRCAEHD